MDASVFSVCAVNPGISRRVSRSSGVSIDLSRKPARSSARAVIFAKNLTGARHWTNNHVIDGDGDSATHTCYLQLLQTMLAPMQQQLDLLRKAFETQTEFNRKLAEQAFVPIARQAKGLR